MTQISQKNNPPRRTAFFSGSFNPFTLGHKDIVDRALAIFDRVVIGIGHNAAKPLGPAEESCAVINRIYEADDRVEALIFDRLAVEAANSVGACAIIKGVRTVADFEYERQMAEVNRRLSGIETVVMFADPALSAVSSSIVRELAGYGVDVSEFLP